MSENEVKVEGDGCAGCGCLIFIILAFIAVCAVLVKVIRWGFWS